MEIKNPPLVALIGVAVVGLFAALALAAMVNANLFARYDLNTGEYGGGPSVWIAVIPLAIGVLAGIAALVLWGVQRSTLSGAQSTATTNRL